MGRQGKTSGSGSEKEPNDGQIDSEELDGASGGEVLENLWTREDLAEYLRVSDRWVGTGLARARNESGSIPHVELPTNGSRRYIRFLPDVIRRWARLGFPPVADYESLEE